MHRIHSGLTVAVPIKKDKSEPLRTLLKELHKRENEDRIKCKNKDEDKDENNRLNNFHSSETTLFASGVILPVQYYNDNPLPETFVFATSYVGPFSKHLEDLVKTNKKSLCEIFRYCEDFMDGDLIPDEFLINYLKSKKYPDTFNSRYNCITKKDVQREKELKNEIEDYIDSAQKLNALNTLTGLEIKTLIQRHIKTRSDKYEWAHKPARKNLIEFLAIKRVPIAGFIFLGVLIAFFIFYPHHIGKILLILIASLLTIVLLIFFILLYIARKKNITALRPDDNYVRKIAATQLHPVLNEMTAAAPLKKGWLRRHFYATQLRIIHTLHAFLNVPTVSNIRWLVIDNKKRLLFISNYSNTTDFYVRDFLVGNTPKGVNFMFTNGIGFPDAKLLFLKGIIDDPEGYMNVIHTHQHVTDLWYTHEPDLTIDNIIKNRKIRNGLFKRMNEEEARQWLKLL